MFASRVLRSALVVAEHNNAMLSASSLSAITAAAKFGNVTVLVAGHGCEAVAENVAKVSKVSSVLLTQDEGLKKGLAESIANAVVSAIKKGSYTHVVVPSSNFGKNFLPRVAAELDCAPITDVVSIIDKDTFVRPMYAGNALATVKSADKLKLLSVRTTAFEKSAVTGGTATVEAFAVADSNKGLSTFVNETIGASERPELTAARVVVSGGRGLKSGDNFKLLNALADKLGGAVGASRAAVDAGYVPNTYQVGQTGKVVAPELYIAVGISGAIQHLSGMKDSKTIVCINKDGDAPIFQVSDYGLVADLFDAVPELTSKV
jgi:electron transfer flavoprotein alpha subunit